MPDEVRNVFMSHIHIDRMCAHGNEEMNDSSEPEPIVERCGLILLIAVVIAAMLALTVLLISPVLISPLTPYFYLSQSGSSGPVGREGIELALFPLGAVVGLLTRPRLGRFAALASGRGASWLPFLCSVILVALAWYLVSAWFHPKIAEWTVAAVMERLLGAVLLASVAYAGAVLYPRLTAAMAGAMASPILLSIATLASPQWLDPAFQDMVGLDLEFVTLAIGVVIFLLSLDAWFRLRTHTWSHAVWAGGLMLFFAARGYWA